MKKMLIVAVTAVMTSGIAFAQQSNTTPATNTNTPAVDTQKKDQPVAKKEMKKEKKVAVKNYKGILDSVNLDNNTIVVKDMKKEKDVKEEVMHTFTLTPDVKMIMNGKEVTLKDVAKGDKVMIKYVGTIESPAIKQVKFAKPEEHKKAKAEKKEMKKESEEKTMKKSPVDPKTANEAPATTTAGH